MISPFLMLTNIEGRQAPVHIDTIEAMESNERFKLDDGQPSSDTIIVTSVYLGSGAVLHVSDTPEEILAKFAETAAALKKESDDEFNGFPSIEE